MPKSGRRPHGCLRSGVVLSNNFDPLEGSFSAFQQGQTTGYWKRLNSRQDTAHRCRVQVIDASRAAAAKKLEQMTRAGSDALRSLAAQGLRVRGLLASGFRGQHHGS